MKLRPLHSAIVSIFGIGTLGVASMGHAADAPGAKVYGDVAIAIVSTGASTSGGKASLTMADNVSLLGVKGTAAEANGVKFTYDYNAILDVVNGGGGLGTHLGILGLEGSFGTVTMGRDNGLFSSMVDGGTYATNWFYTPGMSSLQVGKSIKYVTPSMGGFQAGVQLFDLGKGPVSGKSTTNTTIAGSLMVKSFMGGIGFTKYSDYADDSGTKYTTSSDTNQFAESTNTFAGDTLKSTFGISGAYKADAFGVVGALDMRKPNNGAANTKSMNTLMLTGTFSATPTVTLAANISNTTQADDGAVDGKKGRVITLMASYVPVANVLYSVEFQSSNKDANMSGITGATGAGGTKANTGMALGATYNF